jgi:hypothetical protein
MHQLKASAKLRMFTSVSKEKCFKLLILKSYKEFYTRH